MIKRGMFFVFMSFFLILVSSVVYADFDFEVTPVKNDITPSSPAVFEVKILNKESKQDTFILSVLDISWSILSEPLSDYFSGMVVDANSEKTTTLRISSAGGLSYGTYKVILKAKSSKTSVSKTEEVVVNLLPPEPVLRDYLAAVSRIVDIPSKIDPRKSFEVKINMINRNPKNISNMLIRISTRDGLFSDEIRTSLEPLGKNVVAASFDLDDLTPPQEDLLLVSLIVDNRVLQPEIQEHFEVIGYSEIIEQASETKKSFLKTVTEITYYNNGNIKAVRTIELETNTLKKLFTKTWPKEFRITREGKQYTAWQLGIEPQSTVTVKIQESYRSLFFLCILIVVGLVVYYFFRSPVAIKKEATVIGLREGGISELRVLLNVRNRSKKAFEKVTVIDRIPKIADLEKSFDTGTLNPSKIFQHGKHGTVIKWEIDSFDRFEERMLSYKVKSKLSILGAFNLPAAIVRFHDREGKKFITKSNKSKISL